jgi:hypothetical protein
LRRSHRTNTLFDSGLKHFKGGTLLWRKLRPDDMNVVAALSNRVSEVSITRAPHDFGCTDRISDEKSGEKVQTTTISAILSVTSMLIVRGTISKF